jgi:hypothetical protein
MVVPTTVIALKAASLEAPPATIIPVPTTRPAPTTTAASTATTAATRR